MKNLKKNRVVRDFDLSNVESSPLRHVALPLEITEKVKESYRLLGVFSGKSYQEYEDDFRRDYDYRPEVNLMLAIARTCEEYWAMHKITEKEQRHLVYAELLAESLGGRKSKKELSELFRTHCTLLKVASVQPIEVIQQ